MQRLDDSQRAFCEAPENDNIRLLAPAGCGKTLCLLHRCTYLANQKPDKKMRFLIVTFTRAAEQELSARLSDDPEFADLKEKASVEVTTLNAWGWKRVRSKVSSYSLIDNYENYKCHMAMVSILPDIWNSHEYVKKAVKKRKHKILMKIIDRFKELGFDHVHHKNFTKFLDHLNALYEQNLGLILKEQFDDLFKCKILDKDKIINDSGLNDSGDLTKGMKESLFEHMILTIKDDVTYKTLMENFRKILAKQCYDFIFKFWIQACNELERKNVFTLTDQKYIPLIESIRDTKFLSKNSIYDYIFVDEFQDINPLDLNLVKAIVKCNQSKLTIVGDDDQAIFEWRGAAPQYILDPERFFDLHFKTYKLETNYRSPSNIVQSSQRLIANNRNRVDKNIKSASHDEAEIQFYRTENLRDHLEIVRKIIKQSERNCNSSRIAIIGRNKYEIIPYQIYFASEMEIPFYAAEDLQIYLSDAFKNLLSLLDIKIKIKNQPVKIDDILKLCDYVRKYPLHKSSDRNSFKRYLLYESNTNRLEQEKIINIIKNYPGPWRRSIKPVDVSRAMAEGVKEFVEAESVSDVLRSLQEKFTGFQRDFGKADEDIFYTDPPFQQLADYAQSYKDDFSQFLENMRFAESTLARSTDSGDECKDSPLDYRIHLMTAPRAKGKEFDIVVLLNVKKDAWPDRRATSRLEKLEAERRLFYVVFTRAKKKIVMLLGNSQDEDSPYIDELELPEHPGR